MNNKEQQQQHLQRDQDKAINLPPIMQASASGQFKTNQLSEMLKNFDQNMGTKPVEEFKDHEKEK